MHFVQKDPGQKRIDFDNKLKSKKTKIGSTWKIEFSC